MQLYALKPLLKFCIHLSVNIFLPADKNFLGKIAEKYMENLKQAVEIFKHSNDSQNLLVKSFSVVR